MLVKMSLTTSFSCNQQNFVLSQEQADSCDPRIQCGAFGSEHHTLPGHGVPQPEKGTWTRLWRRLADTAACVCAGHSQQRRKAELQAALHAPGYCVENGAHTEEQK